ncbi:hypothetical protein L4X63_16925 [Geomonas sp. Red32]|uniref:hypothetical protein n=1 Tax=Geomonas sp. Red32 TaxID=2912856 RepID=UPI00202CAFD0|nr:hypothetical protein [Geomonas sp. Red32]MCM0083271.1 hypothetical protein [Geomonas sp. Red32]
MIRNLIDLHPRMDHEEWLQLLGSCWLTSAITPSLYQLMQIMGTDGPLLPMMTDQEQDAYNSLPDSITVYRGGFACNIHGASWTQNALAAALYPFEHIKRGTYPDLENDRPLLATATVGKRNVMAVKICEQYTGFTEIITFSAQIQRVELLTTHEEMLLKWPFKDFTGGKA